MNIRERTAPFSTDLLQSQPQAETNLDGENYSGTGLLLAKVAESFGADIGDQEVRDWRALLGGAYIIDQLLDVEKSGSVVPHITSILAGENLEGIRIGSQDRIRKYMAAQTPERQSEIMDKIGLVGILTEALTETEEAEELVRLRNEEADVYSGLLALPVEGRHDAAQRSVFNDWLASFSRAGYLIDSLVDMKEDHQSGATSVRPSLRSRAVVGRHAVSETATTLRKTPYRAIGQIAMVGFRYQVLNRKPDLSKLRASQP
ncbi:hypothetical protein HY857_00930 [Candidatus Saccharibacteria bacterium]|nr:hypothetical protein [Candidatus Saccharibacteria bacterium]